MGDVDLALAGADADLFEGLAVGGKGRGRGLGGAAAGWRIRIGSVNQAAAFIGRVRRTPRTGHPQRSESVIGLNQMVCPSVRPTSPLASSSSVSLPSICEIGIALAANTR